MAQTLFHKNISKLNQAWIKKTTLSSKGKESTPASKTLHGVIVTVSDCDCVKETCALCTCGDENIER